MNYPIVDIETKDGLWLHGLLIEAKDSKAIYIHTHGQASNFYEMDFMEPLAEKLSELGISLLSTNNRGVGVYDVWDKKGAATEIFEESVLDLDAWIKFAIDRGYSKIILSGHSLGCEKVVYYMNEGTYKDSVSLVMLLAPAGHRWRYYDKEYKLSEDLNTRMQAQLNEARQLVKEGKGDEIISRVGYGGAMPKTPKSMLNMWGENTEIAKALPFYSGRLEMFSKIQVPIFVAIGDVREYTGLPPQDTLDLMRKENSKTETHLLPGCDHDFEGCEEAVSGLIFEFVKKSSL